MITEYQVSNEMGEFLRVEFTTTLMLGHPYQEILDPSIQSLLYLLDIRVTNKYEGATIQLDKDLLEEVITMNVMQYEQYLDTFYLLSTVLNLFRDEEYDVTVRLREGNNNEQGRI